MTFNVPALIHKAAAYITQFITYVRANGYTYKNPCETWANMNKFENATLLLEPKAYKAGSIQCTVPATAAGGLTFSRTGPATVVNEYGKLVTEASNVPRLSFQNYDCGEWLLEPARTNLLTYSEQFDNAAWGKTNVGTAVAPIVTANQGIAPDGTMTADRVQFNAGGGLISDRSILRQPVTTSAVDYSLSFYVKSSTGAGSQDLAFHFDGGTVANKITANETEWTRVDYVASSSGGSLYFGIEVRGTFSDVTADILIWGAQLEEGGYPTSYIKTEAATVTRSAETLSKTGIADLLGDAEGTIFFEGSFSQDGRITLSDGTTSNRMSLYMSPSNAITFLTVVGGVIEGSGGFVGAFNTDYKIAVKYAANDFALWVNGVEVATDLNGSTFADGTLIRLGFDNGTGDSNFYGNIKAVAVWDTALTDAELTTLTT